jgi:Tol biopolymer transport system component
MKPRLILVGLLSLVAISAAAGSVTAPTGEIAYLATKGNIYVINADGTGRRQVLSGSSMDTFNWSSDGRLIAFAAGRWGESGELVQSRIRISRADGTVVRTLPLGVLASALEPTWSPDRKRLAFSGFDARDDTLSIYVVNADGTGLRRLTRHASLWDEAPDWSPNGQWIAFERYDATGGSSSMNVMAVHPDGKGLHRIARVITGPQCACADWSPDGSRIAYQASPTVATSRYPEIYTMNADGTERTQLTFTGNRVRDENPDWSPDGKWIAFYSERVGNAEIFVIGADGKNLARITREKAYVMFPRWRPAG